jgi:transcriptional regulator with XRE-family HTH domain
MSRIDRFRGRYIHPEDFRDLRRAADLTRKQAADLLDVAVRTVQNWETGGARIPWMAYRMLRILTGYALLPGKAWDGWSVHGDRLIAPNGRWYEANTLEQIEHVFGMARLWRKDYHARNADQTRHPAFGTSPHGLSADLHPTAQETPEALTTPFSGKPVLIFSAGGQR